MPAVSPANDRDICGNAYRPRSTSQILISRLQARAETFTRAPDQSRRTRWEGSETTQVAERLDAIVASDMNNGGGDEV